MIIKYIELLILINVISFGCGGEESAANNSDPISENQYANVNNVDISGSSENYSLIVTISSPDTGCDQYADFWEVVSEEGELIYRRILLHSHINEQPFARSGGPVPIETDQVVWVRAHMSNTGYGGQVFKGSVASGFQPTDTDANFAPDLASTGPQTSCEF